MDELLKSDFLAFAERAAPVLRIRNEAGYSEALELVEELADEAEETGDTALAALVGLLGKSIAVYESHDAGLVPPRELALDDPPDVALLKLLMDQHGLGIADLPEIGDKSLVSRILSGSRNLTKQHIITLSRRFGVEPGMFFD